MISPRIPSRLRRHAVAVSLSLGLLVAPVAALADAPKVVASIKPIHSLVASVMQGVGTPILIVDGMSSPHGYALKPSQMSSIENADMVFWVGPMMEGFLEKPLEGPGAPHSVELHETSGVHLMNYKEEHDHDGDHAEDVDDHDHDQVEEAGHDDDHEEMAEEGELHHHHHSGVDGHIWLDPENAIAMADGIAAALSEIDPDHAITYNANAAKLRADLSALTEKVAAELAPVAGRHYIVFHNAYQYFEARFGMDSAGAVTINPELSPSAAHIAEVRGTIRETGAACIFSEPQFPEKLVDVVAEGTSLNRSVLDPLGSTLEPGPGLYVKLIESLTDHYVSCLGSAS